MASGTESATETSYWLKFFTDAKIPAGDAAHYAVLFSDNRIQRGMLLDLTKEYLTDMGVSRLGDVIAILKHARIVHDQDAKDKALKGAKYNISTASPVRRSTAASRMVDHFLNKTPDSGPMNKPLPPKPSLNASISKKSSVFDRLGADSSGSGSSPKTSSGGGESVFSRLGGKSGNKRPASSASPVDSDEDGDEDGPQSPLGYHGILKFPTTTTTTKKKTPSPAVPRKKVRVSLDDDPVKFVGLEAPPTRVKVTGLDKVKVKLGVAGNERFDLDDIEPLKVQVSSTTSSTPRVKRTMMMAMPSSDALVDELLISARKAAIQKAEVTTTTPLTRTAGVLSLDSHGASPASVKTRLGPKEQKAAASSTTAGFGPSTKNLAGSDVKSRLGAKSPQSPTTTTKPSLKLSSLSSLKSRPGFRSARQQSSATKLVITATSPSSSLSPSPRQAKARSASGVFSRLASSSSSSPKAKSVTGVFSRLTSSSSSSSMSPRPKAKSTSGVFSRLGKKSAVL